MILELAAFALIVVNIIQLVYSNHLGSKIDFYEKSAKRFVEAFNEIMLVVNSNADSQRAAIIEVETHEEKIGYLLMLSDIVFKAIGVQKADFKANSNQLSDSIKNTKILEEDFPKV